MKIEVLGPGCPNCTALAAAVKASADKLGIDYELTKVTDIMKITEYGVMMTPALVVVMATMVGMLYGAFA